MEEKPIPLHPLQLQSIEEEATNTYSFIFQKPDNFTWNEGACVHLGNSSFDINKGKANKAFVRHLSIASLPDEEILRFTTRIPHDRSDFKNDLAHAKPGDSFTLFKPENRMALQRRSRPIVLISAGVGVATTRPMMRAYANSQEGIPALVHINIDSSGEYLYRGEIEGFVRETDGLKNIYVKNRADFYQELETNMQEDSLYYIVGSDAFLIAVGRWLISQGVTQQSILLDKAESFYEEFTEEHIA